MVIFRETRISAANSSRVNVCCVDLVATVGSTSQPKLAEFMYSHALLLRLFLSNSFFSVHVALQYLRLYADNIGEFKNASVCWTIHLLNMHQV